jgi:hypothetical protein
MRSKSRMAIIAVAVATVAGLALSPLRAADTAKQGTGDSIDPRPYLKVPALSTTPALDGALVPGEWDGAARITGFGNYNQNALVPEKLQPSWRIAFDDENLYLVSTWPLYPEGSIKARNKRGDEGGSNPIAASFPDGLLGDDHVEIEISPWPDPNMALTKHFYKWMVNPYGAVVDQRREHAVGWDGFEWESASKVGCKIKDSVWTMEMAIPWSSLGFKEPPKDGTALTLQLVNASDSEQSYLGWVPTGWLSFTGFATVALDRKAPAIQVEKFGELMDGKIALAGAVSNKYGAAGKLNVEFVVDHPEKGELFRNESTVEVPAQGQAPLALEKTLALEQLDSVLWGQGQQLRGKSAYRYQLTVSDEAKQTLFRQNGRFFKRPSDLQTSLFDFLAASRGKSGDPAITTAYMPSYGGCEVSADIDILGIKPDVRAAKTLEVAIERLVEPHQQHAVAGTSYRMAYRREPIPASGIVNIFVETPSLPLGGYGVFCRLLDEKGKVLFEKVDTFTRHHFEWENNTLGKGDVVIPPWTPMTVQKQTVGVWGRDITFGADGLPASVKSQGDELLAKPIRMDASIGGKVATWKTEEPFKVTRAEPGVVETVAKGRLGELPLTVETRTEYDGLTKVTLSLRPEGKTDVTSMDLVIPMAEPVDTTIINGCGGRNPDFFGELPKGEGVLWQSYKNLPTTAGIHGKYISLCYLGNGERGLSYVSWSDQGWMLDDRKDTAEIRRVNGVVELVLHLANTPRRIDAPRQIQFALQATPVKPMTPGYRRDVNPISKINTAPKKPLDAGGIRSSMGGHGLAGMAGTDQVTLTDETDWAILRETILRQKRNSWPKYNALTAKYTATNTLGLGMREYETYAGEWAFTTEPKPNPTMGVGYRGEFGYIDPRQQTRIYQDLLPSSVDMRVWSFDQLQKKGGLNGFWWDHEAYWSSASLRRGTAYLRDDGQVQGTLNIPLFRDLFKRMATVSHQNAMFNVQGRYPHSGNVPAINGYCSYLWATEGFWYMPNLSFDQYDNVGGLAGYRALIGRWVGVPVLHRAVTQDREFNLDKGERPFQSRSIIGMALLHDVGLEPHALHPELVKKTATLLDTFDLFDDSRTEWIPYWRSGALAKPDRADAVATVYKNHPKKGQDEALVVVFNTRKETTQTTVALDGVKLLGRPIRECLDLETGKSLGTRFGEGKAAVTVPLESHDYRLVLVK